MPKICPNCNKVWPEEFMACPLDGTALVPKPQQPAGFNLNLGDANAISGGVSMSDNHSVSNNTVNTTTSNVDSHNVITNNITLTVDSYTKIMVNTNKVNFIKSHICRKLGSCKRNSI